MICLFHMRRTRGVYYLLTKDKEPYGLEDGAYHNGERLQ